MLKLSPFTAVISSTVVPTQSSGVNDLSLMTSVPDGGLGVGGTGVDVDGAGVGVGGTGVDVGGTGVGVGGTAAGGTGADVTTTVMTTGVGVGDATT
jgi:hypothetical protein